MDLFKEIYDLTVVPGVTGHEAGAGDLIKEKFKAFTDDVWQDTLGNVYGRIGVDGEHVPTVLVMAHMDEIGLMVADIEENGMLRLINVGGVDPRVLPGAEVLVYGKEPLIGVIGAIPPHLIAGKQKAYPIEDLVCDIGYPPEKVRELVRVGDYITFAPKPPVHLKNDYITSKSLDDRALCAAMLRTMELLKNVQLECSVVFCASIQEERGGLGGTTAAYHINPDIALAIDVTHGPTSDAQPFSTYPMDKVTITTGGNIHPGVFDMLKTAAKELNIQAETETAIGHTGTDAWNMQVMRGGIATGILSPPLRYMHTSVECFRLSTLDKVAKVLAGMLSGIDENWEDALCWNN